MFVFRLLGIGRYKLPSLKGRPNTAKCMCLMNPRDIALNQRGS